MRFSRTNPNQTPGKHYSRAQKSVSNHSQQNFRVERHHRPHRSHTQLRIMYIMLNMIYKYSNKKKIKALLISALLDVDI